MAPTVTAIANAATAHDSHDARRVVPVLAAATAPSSSETKLRSSRTSRAELHRPSGSFARHRATMRSRVRGLRGDSFEIGSGSRARTAAMRLACVLPENAFCPVSISWRTTPRAKMSVRASAAFPSSLLGRHVLERSQDRAFARERFVLGVENGIGNRVVRH